MEQYTPGPGRPRIFDHLEVLLYVETRRRAEGLSVRKLTDNPRMAFVSRYVSEDGTRRTLTGDALRARHRDARKGLGLSPRVPGLAHGKSKTFSLSSDGALEPVYSDDPAENETLKSLAILFRDEEA